MSFHIGDIVRVIAGPRVGVVTTVTSELIRGEQFWETDLYRFTIVDVHRLDIPSDDLPIGAPPAWLEHYREPAVDAMLGRLGVRETEEA